MHVKDIDSHSVRALLASRALLVKIKRDLENHVRGLLKNLGLVIGRAKFNVFAVRAEELIEGRPELIAAIRPLLEARTAVEQQVSELDRKVMKLARHDAQVRRFMTVPGVGPVVTLTYRATVDVPARFRKSKSVGAVFGLTCSRHQSGEVDWSGKMSRCGDEMMRTMLYEAAQSMLRSKKWSWLKAWAMQIARRRGMKKAIVALARRLAVIMHRIGVDGTEFRWTQNKPRQQQHENRSGSNPIGENSSSTEPWKDVPLGTMDEVSSYVRLDPPFLNGKADQKIVPPRPRIP